MNTNKSLAKYFEPSSRISALEQGRKSAGASCNVFVMEDSIDSIAEGIAWSVQVLAYQGAPTVYLGKLRPPGAPISSGGTSSGPVSFAEILDAVFASMRRTEKKNGAGQLIMPWNYPDRQELVKFLTHPFKAAYRAVYVPRPNTEEADKLLRDKELVQLLSQAYDNFQCFLVKEPAGAGLFTNLCTEVEIPHRGTCVLGAINLSQFSLSSLVEKFSCVMKEAAKCMYKHMRQSNELIKSTPLFCNDPRNRQFGLGLFGMASFLGANGVSYRELADALLHIIYACGGRFATIEEIYQLAEDLQEQSLANQIVAALARGYLAAAQEVEGLVERAFCFQPTVSTAHRSTDRFGFVSSPELQPVIGLKTEESVRTIIKSAVKGDKLIDYHPRTWTVYEVPYEDYRDLSAAMQLLIQSTGLAHRHSHCFYGEKFTEEDFVSWFTKEPFLHIQSLYYRLKPANDASLRKDQLWQSTEGIVDFDFDVDQALAEWAQQPGQISCACEG
jgi:ribonucleotide reductase alpha subunit